MVRNHIFSLFFLVCSTFSLNGMNESLLRDQTPHLQVIVKNVGQGNCILVKVPSEQDSSKYTYMLVDCGSSSLKKPKAFSQVPHSRSSSESDSGDQGGGYSQTTKEIELNKTTQKDINKAQTSEEVQNSIIDLIQSDNIDGTFIQTVVITHPERDHCNWIPDLFPIKEEKIKERLKVKNIVLGGPPEEYFRKAAIAKWITKLLEEGNTNVYFTAVSPHKVTQENIEDLKEGTYKKARFEVKAPLEDFDNSFRLGNRYLISLLALNATHVTPFFADNNKDVAYGNSISVNMIDKQEYDKNTDSIILQIKDTETGQSALLTGDSTGITTTRLMDYVQGMVSFQKGFNLTKEEFYDLIQSDVLIASHHGSSSHGTNNKAYIETVRPKFVILSTGGMYGHPSKKAYYNFHYEGLAKVNQHSVYVGGISGVRAKNHQTKAGIFSTLPHDDIIIHFPSMRGQPIKIHSKNSKTGTFISKDSEDLSNTFVESNEPLSGNELSNELERIEKDILDPLTYSQMVQAASAWLGKPQHSILEITLDGSDPRNDFILNYMNDYIELQTGMKNQNVEELYKVRITLIYNEGLIKEGKVTFEPLQENLLTIPEMPLSIQDQRNHPLLEQILEIMGGVDLWLQENKNTKMEALNLTLPENKSLLRAIVALGNDTEEKVKEVLKKYRADVSFQEDNTIKINFQEEAMFKTKVPRVPPPLTFALNNPNILQWLLDIISGEAQ